ncbi:hypothetical protein Salat_2537100 [Sesamum alatum]|uniref:DUF659 domain-containing protein n=1 Tax=Sesamum alatum TaxID=300844 RepID=A0AAE1XSG8_9LAMI|nr:hypothetical protein Salat_2537100 [Sesamum alatum]
MWKNNNSFKSAKHAIGKWFIFSNIPPNAAVPYYQAAIDEIARVGVGVKGPTPYEITGPILDAELEEIQEYVNGFKKKWETYGVTIMCDGWTSTTKLSIINFLIYCNGKIVFHKSINASGYNRDANYIYELMDDVVEEIGKKYVVQVITDNGSAYKKAGELLMRKRKHLYWTPCAAHCIDLILEDFAEKTTVKVVIEQAKKISNFIYNHGKVLDIMRKYTDGKELLRPGITCFATNYTSMESILEQKLNLQRMFTSEEWSKNPGSKDPSGKAIQDVILNSSFWNSAELVCNLHAPVSRVLCIVDGEKQATMGYVFEGMRRSKLAIEAALPRSHKKYCDIIDRRLKNQMLHDIHLAAYYLNPAYHYELELSHKPELLDALKKVVQKIEPDANIASLALSEGKYFREAMYGFADSTAIRGRKKTDPGDALLDEIDDDGQPVRPNTFLATWAERQSGPSRNSVGSDKGGEKHLIDEDDESGFLTSRIEDIVGGDNDNDDTCCFNKEKNIDENDRGSSHGNQSQASPYGIYFTEE